jgi:hypothetical protein
MLAGIGAWVYIQKENLAQKNRALEQQKQLTQYEQQKIDERAKKDRQCEQAAANSDSSFSGILSCN